jgi:Gpi18-like mannosyltransferase
MNPATEPISVATQQDALEKEINSSLIEKLNIVLINDRVIAIGLFLLVLITRIPFQSQILYHWDSVNFAAAIYQFDLANESPHPPGYIVYVWLTQIVNRVVQDPQVTMVSISIIASALAVVAMYLLGKAMYSRKIGLIASLLLASSPIFWFYGEIALPHTLDAFFVILSAWLLYKTMQEDYRFLYPALLSVAIAGGLRPQTLVFLFPLVLYSIRKAGIKRIIGAGAAGAVVCVLWFIPLINASGGFSTYMEIMGNFSDRFQESTSIFMGAGAAGIQRNTSKVVLYTLYGVSLAIVPLLIYGGGLVAKRIRTIAVEKSLFLAFWMAPVLFFYLAIHMGQQGLIFVYLPALLLMAAVGLARIFWGKPLLLLIGTASIVLFNAGVFVLLPEYPLGPGTQRMLTRDTLRNSDRYFQARIEAIEYNFEAGKTGIIARDWRHADFYLPEYSLVPLDPARWDEFGSLKSQGYLTIDNFGYDSGQEEIVYLVLFDGGLDQRDQSMYGKLKQIPMDNGEQLRYYEMRVGDRLYIEIDPIQITLK